MIGGSVDPFKRSQRRFINIMKLLIIVNWGGGVVTI